MSTVDVTDTFKEMVKKDGRPKYALKSANVLPSVSPKCLRRIVKSIPTPKSESSFTCEETIALMLQLGLSRDSYIILRKALSSKGINALPSYGDLQETKQNILLSPTVVTNSKATVSLSVLLENTAVRIVLTLSAQTLKEVNQCNVQLICKWGCDGLSTLLEYKQASTTDYRSVFMASLVPLRIRKHADTDYASTSFNDIWINSTPGSKNFCRPLCFEFTKESTINTQYLVQRTETEFKNLESVTIEIMEYIFQMGFNIKLTMIDGKVSNTLTGISLTRRCGISGKKKSDFKGSSKDLLINWESLEFGISPLHARIRFLEHFLHLLYDLKYHRMPTDSNKSLNKQESKEMRAKEKNSIQYVFKSGSGLNIDKPLFGFGSTNDGNTARGFFMDSETTTEITRIVEILVQKLP
uniref:V(D)J recombination-activating protein 1 RNase H domain-containing protein n=1 Tax=Stomoxys calcitrans TaxID=35570 RepID=A0A1I8NZC6_STOCA